MKLQTVALHWISGTKSIDVEIRLFPTESRTIHIDGGEYTGEELSQVLTDTERYIAGMLLPED